MKIAIDARMYGKGFGLARYVESLVHGLEQYPSDFSYTLYLKPEALRSYRKAGGTLEVIEAPHDWYGWEEQTAFLSLVNKGTHDLIHFPHWNIPVGYRRPFVVTIHDLIMFHFPRYDATTRSYPVYWIKDKVHRMVVKHAARSAKEIITTSQFTKNDIISTLGIEPEKIKIIYQAPHQETATKSWDEIRLQFGIKNPYALYVGAAYPHKNLKRLVDAWNMVQEKFPDHELLLAGKPSPFYADLKKYIEKNAIQHIRMIGFVEDGDLALFYKHARAVVFPSLYEGFGLPPLEAVLAGTPVIASSAASLPEVLGEAALYVHPEDVNHVADGIARVLGNEEIRSELKQKGRMHIQSFSAELFIQQTLEAYREALGK